MEDNNFIGFNPDLNPEIGKHIYPDRNYHTNANLIERFLVDTVEEAIDSIDRCIERCKLFKIKGTDD